VPHVSFVADATNAGGFLAVGQSTVGICRIAILILHCAQPNHLTLFDLTLDPPVP